MTGFLDSSRAKRGPVTKLFVWRAAVVVLSIAPAIHAGAQGADDIALPPLPPEAVQRLLATPEAAYALISRPSDQAYNRVDILTLDPKTRKPITRTPTEMGCTRVHATQDGRVFCFTRVLPDKPRYYSPPTGYVYSNAHKLQTSYTKGLGAVSRARISQDGKYTASTAFTAGHSYLGVGGTSFSTATFVGHSTDAKSPENIQRWPVVNAGTEITALDLNLWGASFDPANSDRFLVTAYFNGKPHLAEGSMQRRRITVLKEGVECPSFSPDGKRIAFKKRTGATRWSPAVMDLATKVERVFDVPDSVDDQIEWLDNERLLYEVVVTPLVGASTINLMSLDTRDAKPVQQSWLKDARSPTIVGRRY